jgi:hypothetical protein
MHQPGLDVKSVDPSKMEVKPFNEGVCVTSWCEDPDSDDDIYSVRAILELGREPPCVELILLVHGCVISVDETGLNSDCRRPHRVSPEAMCDPSGCVWDVLGGDVYFAGRESHELVARFLEFPG